MKVSFIGGGAMGEAMLSAVLERGLASPPEVAVSDVAPARLAWLQQKHGVLATSDNLRAIPEAQVIVLAIKPQQLLEVMTQLQGHLAAEQLVVSIVAGATLDILGRGLNHERVVRAMPNIAAQVGEAISLWTAAASVPEEGRSAIRSLLSTLGQEIYTPEEKYLDLATAVSGSGPAYVFLFLESFIDAAVHIGLPRELARELVLQTVLGSARLARTSGQHPAQLRNLVTSPGGTTAEALLRLEEGGFRGLLIRAVSAAYERARGLGEGKSGK